ncbi:MAG TPA: sugar kinase [Planctomycetota bacterium]|nr:sugar kinase [Planctomycetota bacterium]
MSVRFDVACAADCCVDLILQGNVRPRFGQVEQLIERCTLELGGSANIFATQFVKLGGSAAVIGAVGADPFGDLVRERLSTAGVDIRRVRRVPKLQTGVGFTLTEPRDRAILTFLGSINAVRPADLTPALAQSCRHWHIASFFLLTKLRRTWPAWLVRLRRQGVSTSLDTNWDPSEKWHGVNAMLPHVDVFLPNEAEACAISGARDVAAAGRALAARGPLVVIKQGGAGAQAFHRDGIWRVPVSRVLSKPPRVVDSIGAGDNFDAGFLRAWLLKKPIEECLTWGIRCGAASLSAVGGIRGQVVRRLT